MSKFDQIIGYSTIKAELEQIADTLCHREYYERLMYLHLKDCFFMENQVLENP